VFGFFYLTKKLKMDLTLKNIEKLITSKLEEQKTYILLETSKLLKEQEKNFILLISGNFEILAERLDKLENEAKQNKSNNTIIEKDIREMKESLNFQQENITEKMEKITTNWGYDINYLVKKTVDLENRSRRNNLRIDGVKELEGESWENCRNSVKEIIKNKLNISEEIEIERAHRIGSAREDKSPRTIIFKLLNFLDKTKVLNSAKKLRETGLYINEDYAKETIEHRKKLWEEVKRLRKAGKYAIIKFDKIYCREFKK
jgi:hypothetical protein